MSSKRVEEEYKELVAKGSWQQIYQSIGRKCSLFPYTCNEAKKSENKLLNRYRDVNPYDHSRVILKRTGDTDYINANLLKMERANRQYILTQGPLGFTVEHFWTMVWEQNSRAIIMLNKVIEKKEIKCHWYWPRTSSGCRTLEMQNINLVVEQTEEKDFHHYITRIFKVTDTNTKETRTVTHFHYTTWPDFEVPSSPDAFLEFLEKVRSSGALEADVGPAVVHCSAGIGRSGTFCLVDTVLLLIEKGGQANIDIQDILLEMRKYRMGLIQTSEQLRFSYEAIIEGIKRMDPEYRAQMNESVYYSPVADEEGSSQPMLCQEAQMNKSVYYCPVEDKEDSPPPPPPRGESLTRRPLMRPLPPIPSSSSMVDLARQAALDDSSSSEDEAPPLLPPRNCPSSDSTASFHNEQEETERHPHLPDDSLERAEIRRRRQEQLAEKISSMRKRLQESDSCHSFKRSFYTPIAISVGFLLAGILIYCYVKH